MSDFQFICPFCEKTLDCPEELDGKETECPICNNIIVTVKPDNNLITLSSTNTTSGADENKKDNFSGNFIAQCPLCKKIIEFPTEFDYSRQECPFCKKIVLTKTTKKQEIIGKSFLSASEKYNAHQCRHCKNIIITPQRLYDKIILCPDCKKTIWLCLKNKISEQKDEPLEVYVANTHCMSGFKDARIFCLDPDIQNNIPKNIARKKQTKGPKSREVATGCTTLIIIILIIYMCVSCATSCNTTSSSDSKMNEVNYDEIVNANMPSKSEVIQKSKDLLLTAVSGKVSYSDIKEISNSFYVNTCVIDSKSASIHATFKLKGLENAYSVEFEMKKGVLTPTQIYYDNGITPAFYWKK